MNYISVTLQQSPIIILTGPTASGKTAAALSLVKRFNCEIISVDSALVYRGMDIGTAKPDAAMQAEAPHRLIDICEPTESYSVAAFLDDVNQEIAAIHANGNVPLLVGGTTMYIRALVRGLHNLPSANDEIRLQLEEEAAIVGWPMLHQRLAAVDSKTAERLSINDSQRIQRALEVYMISGKPLSVWHAEENAYQCPWPWLSLVVSPQDRAILHQCIELRFEQMMEQGFLEEVEGLYQRADLHAELPSMRCVGYRQLWNYLAGEWSIDEAVQRGIFATRQLAKRQLTMLRSEKGFNWVDSSKDGFLVEIEDKVSQFLEFDV